MRKADATLDQLLAEIGGDLGRGLSLRPSAGRSSSLFPPPLAELFAVFDGGDIGFGELWTAAESLDKSSAAAFAPGWVAFGQDLFFTFWLCAREPREGRWFTAWDHESGTEIGEPLWTTLPELIAAQYDELLDTRAGEGIALVLTHVPLPVAPAVLLEVKGLLGLGSAKAKRALEQFPLEIPVRAAADAHAAMRRLRHSGVECHVQL